MRSMTEKKSEIGSVMKKGVPWKRTQASTTKPWQKTKQEFRDKRKSASHQTGNPSSCRNCGHQHPPKLGKECRKCEKKNHWAKFCLSSTPTRIIKAVNKEDSEERYVIEEIEQINQAEGNQKEANVVVKIHGSDIRVALYTGAEVDIMPDRVLKKVMANNKTQILKIQLTKRKLMGYGGDQIPVDGTCSMMCNFGDKSKEITFYIVESQSGTVLSLQSCRDLNMMEMRGVEQL